MFHILVIEDLQEKLRAIVGAIGDVDGMTLDNIDVVGDAYNAKKALKSKHYALVILDINIPPRLDKMVKEGGGLDILSFIKLNSQAIAPDHIVGMTSYESAYDLAQSEFASLIMKLIRYDEAGGSWREQLIETVKVLLSKDFPPYVNDGSTYHTSAAIICALPEELNSLLAIDANWEEVTIPHDSGRYFRARQKVDDKFISIVATAAPRMGMPVAGVVAAKVISAFRPRILAMCGICAGVRARVSLGDLLVADPCFDWGSGKWISDTATGGLRFLPAPYQSRLDQDIRSLLLRFWEDDGIIENIVGSYSGKVPNASPQLFIEAMASGGSVLQAQSLVEEVQEQHKNLVGVEMESYAVFAAAEYADKPRPLCVSIKAVCDFGDEEKTDRCHSFACHISARFVFQFMLYYFGRDK